MEQDNKGIIGWGILGLVIISIVLYFWKFFLIIGLIIGTYFLNKSNLIHLNIFNRNKVTHTKHTGRKVTNWIIVLLLSIFIINGTGSSNASNNNSSKNSTNNSNKIAYVNKDKKHVYKEEKEKHIALLAQKEKLQQEKIQSENDAKKTDNTVANNNSQKAPAVQPVRKKTPVTQRKQSVTPNNHPVKSISKPAQTEVQPIKQNNQDTTIVYITQTGSKYHYSNTCRALRRSRNLRTMTVAQATAQGYGPCGLE